MNIEQLYSARCSGGAGAQHADMLPHMAQLRSLASECKHCTEFGVRTGQSTVAMLAGLGDGGALQSYDLNPPQFDFTAPNWTFTQADTGKLESIAETDLLFIDTLHTNAQVRAELKHANSARKYLVFHDVRMFGWAGECYQDGILPPIFDFMRDNPQWHVRAFCDSPWGMLVLIRK